MSDIPETTTGAPVEEAEQGSVVAEEQKPSGFETIPISTLIEQGGANHARLSGVVVDIKGGSGLILRCPACKRVLDDNSECYVHGKVHGITDLRAVVVLDDGTGAIQVVIGAEVLSTLIERSLDELIMDNLMYQKEDELDIAYVRIADALLARPMFVSGWAPDRNGSIQVIAKWVGQVFKGEEREAIIQDTFATGIPSNVPA